MKPVVIDAATALRMLMPPDDKKADPYKEAELVERAFRAGLIRMLGLHGQNAVEHERVFPERVPGLLFDWLARKSEVDDQLGEADLVSPFNGRVLPYEPVWLDLRFEQKVYAAWVKQREIGVGDDPLAIYSPGRPMAAMKALLAKAFPNGRPGRGIRNKAIYAAIADAAKGTAWEGRIDERLYTSIRRAAGRRK